MVQDIRQQILQDNSRLIIGQLNREAVAKAKARLIAAMKKAIARQGKI